MATSERDTRGYSVLDADGHVELGPEHPGFADPDYRARRDEVAGLSIGWRPGMPVPRVAYTAAEDQVWATVWTELAPLLHHNAARCILDGMPRLALPEHRVPQLDEVSAALRPLTGFAYGVVPGLAELREFYGALADGLFLSTQYLRHPSVPLYTPEPDVIHEVVGHGLSLAVPELAELCRAMGRATRRVTEPKALEALSRIFWFSVEFGCVWEHGELRTYGAGILSSFGELSSFTHAEVCPIDLAAMATHRYDITRYQPLLFAGRSLTEVVDVVGGCFEEADDDHLLALVGASL
ncbi:MAG: phenylalanine 4-monooxygenase [Actinomycetota bacterium]|nr:phenylalanine 4-monooxygenase [Actinomycetota bacterium]